VNCHEIFNYPVLLPIVFADNLISVAGRRYAGKFGDFGRLNLLAHKKDKSSGKQSAIGLIGDLFAINVYNFVEHILEVASSRFLPVEDLKFRGEVANS
jgi:hypothetical protein